MIDGDLVNIWIKSTDHCAIDAHSDSNVMSDNGHDDHLLSILYEGSMRTGETEQIVRDDDWYDHSFSIECLNYSYIDQS